MATIVTKYSDYEIHSIEWFIEKINTELAYRDLPGLTNNKVQKVSVTKQHPLVALMAANLQGNLSDIYRSGILPSISVTPTGAPGQWTLGQGLKTGVVDSDFITNLQTYQAKTDKNRLDDGLLTVNQVNSIVAAYNANDAGNTLYEIHQWRKNEAVSISSWSTTADVDNLLSDLLDSILAEIQIGFLGDDSPIVDFKYDVVKGLTNFNYGRVIFGTEYSLTFLNTFNNYTIYTEDKVSTHESNFTYTTPGE